MVKVFIGYDSRMEEDFNVAFDSLMENSTVPLSITPLNLKNLKYVYSREADPKASNEFSYSRFLVPYLSNYSGWSLFVDGDVVFLNDIWWLCQLRNEECAVQVVKHDYTPKSNIKFKNNTQHIYPKKNWSSVMLFNNKKCRNLTEEVVNSETGAYLHQFKWIDESQIGSLPIEWNYLVGEYSKIPRESISLLHYTEGSPLHEEYRKCDYANEWLKYGGKYL
tara:strand:- start:44 stop:706 length:663 start_codon:yes stop_codon:yes gene_type:complete